MGFDLGGKVQYIGDLSVEKICKICKQVVAEINPDQICKDCQQPS